MLWYYTISALLTLMTLGVIVQWKRRVIDRDKIDSLTRLNRGLQQRLQEQAACLSNAHEEITRLERVIDDSHENGPNLPILRNILKQGLVANISHEGSTFHINIELSASYYNEVDLTNNPFPACPQLFLHRDVQRLVQRWSHEVTPTIINEIYRQLCASLNLVPIEPVFLNSNETPVAESTKKASNGSV